MVRRTVGNWKYEQGAYPGLPEAHSWMHRSGEVNVLVARYEPGGDWHVETRSNDYSEGVQVSSSGPFRSRDRALREAYGFMQSSPYGGEYRSRRPWREYADEDGDLFGQLGF